MFPILFLGGLIPYPGNQGNDWIQSDITVPVVTQNAPDEWVLGWIMAEEGHAQYVQIGWYATPQGTFPFIEHDDDGNPADFHRTIFGCCPLDVGQTIRVALSNDEGTHTWHYWMSVNGEWVQLGSSDDSFGNEDVDFTRYVEVQPNTSGQYPSVGQTIFTNAGLVHLGTWVKVGGLVVKGIQL